MPVRVRIDVNGRDQQNLWIGRIDGTTDPDSLNTYAIGLGTEHLEAWNLTRLSDLPTYTHRYGDGLLICVEKGLAAWNAKETDNDATAQS